MTKQNLARQPQMLWRALARRLSLVDYEPRVSRRCVDRVLERLPQRAEDEDMESWVRRVTQVKPPEALSTVTLLEPSRRRFTPLTEIVRMAASTNEGTGIPLPEPGRRLQTPDGRFRLVIEAKGPDIVIAVQALGFAADDFANRSIGIASTWDDEPVVIVKLDADGDGRVQVPDSDKMRRALLRLVVGVVEDD